MPMKVVKRLASSKSGSRKRNTVEREEEPVLVFDLDLTLYSKKDFVDDDDMSVYYKSFIKNPLLNKLLDKIKYRKYILTNGTYDHAIEVLERLGIEDKFNNIHSIDMAKGYLKPDIPMYLQAIKKFKIKNNTKVYYYEDLEENLEAAKDTFGWTTILITEEHKRKPKYVDYIFPTVEEALIFLSTKQEMERKTKKVNDMTMTV